jgi:multiple sugar transport system substrate-binding protein
MSQHRVAMVVAACVLALSLGCRSRTTPGIVITFPASRVGKEREILERQVPRFEAAHPGIQVVLQDTPDASDQRHQLYVQWLNAGAGDPDILQLDVIWTAEFAAAGWIHSLDRLDPNVRAHVKDFFPSTLAANEWTVAGQAELFALPWFVDVGMLYYRRDLVPTPPATFDELTRAAENARSAAVPYGLLWQGSRYEGLVCVFLEYLGGHGGRIMDEEGRIVVDAAPAVQALGAMRDALYASKIVPQDTLTWKEEQTRFRFQNGEAVFLRNWPYAYALMQDPSQSRVAGKFGVALMPRTATGKHTAALGGSQLAINRNSEHPREALALLRFLTEESQMRERAQLLGQFPPSAALYATLYQGLNPEEQATRIPAGQIRAIIEQATPRPITPVYPELSEILQIALHEALTGQKEPAAALKDAAEEMRRVLRRAGLSQE